MWLDGELDILIVGGDSQAILRTQREREERDRELTFTLQSKNNL